MNHILGFAHRLRNFIWILTNKVSIGVRVIAINDREILLVKHTYRPYWYLPGGGIKPGETIEQAARREVFEEAGTQLEGLSLLGVYTDFQEGRSDHIVVFIGNIISCTPKSNVEIEDVKMFNLNEMPTDISIGCFRRVQEYIRNKTSNVGDW